MAADISDLIDPDKRLIELMKAPSGGYSIKTYKLVNFSLLKAICECQFRKYFGINASAMSSKILGDDYKQLLFIGKLQVK